jgi:exosome complex RNA-binding protein Rrp4
MTAMLSPLFLTDLSHHPTPITDTNVFPAALSGPRKDWMTGQSVYGELKGGTLVNTSTALARRLLSPSCALLSTLGSSLPFELAVGVNGLVWAAAGNVAHTVAVTSAIERAEHLDEAQCATLAEQLAKDAMMRR